MIGVLAVARWAPGEAVGPHCHDEPTIDHLGIQCSDVAASAAFYDRVLEPLGARRLMEPAPDVIGYGSLGPDF